MNAPASQPSLPPRPRLVLRLGFAGRQDLGTQEGALLDASLTTLLGEIGKSLHQITRPAASSQDQEAPVTTFYSSETPLLRMVTGLCQGADTRAGAAILAAGQQKPGDAQAPLVATELAAVLPFDIETYRQSRPESFRPTFDSQLSQCAWVLALDGCYDKPAVETPLSKHRRARAYRAQAAFLLRQSDLIIVAANPDDAGKAGGALETSQAALAFELPVIFIHTGRTNVTEAVYLIEPEDTLADVLAQPAPVRAERQKRLETWITQLTADPDSGMDTASHGEVKVHAQEESLLKEYFSPDGRPLNNPKTRLTRWREATWKRFEKRFKTGPSVKSDPKLAPYSLYRDRATKLNYHYSGLYRGAFLLNYLFAITAVILAVISLALFAAYGGKAGNLGWLLPVMAVLAASKLTLLILIGRNTQSANNEKWNDRAVDTRYLAERLRGMYYLPELGSQQPPVATPSQFNARAVRQSAVDWLFDAIVRSISPASLPSAQEARIPSHDGQGTVTVRSLLTVNAATSLKKVSEFWIDEQTNYHESNAKTMHAMHHGIEITQKTLGWTVIIIVSFDILLILAKVLHYLPEEWIPVAKAATPWLIAITAILPAVIAALSGVRFQSECQRLSDRSAVMRVVLSGRAGHTGGRKAQADKLYHQITEAVADPNSDPHSWSHDVLRFSERVATDFVHEAAEWSVLYAKEVSDPG